MATGIVSVGCDQHGLGGVAVALFAFNIVAYLVLWTLTGIRLAKYRTELVADLTDHKRGLGFLTSSREPGCSAPRHS